MRTIETEPNMFMRQAREAGVTGRGNSTMNAIDLRDRHIGRREFGIAGAHLIKAHRAGVVALELSAEAQAKRDEKQERISAEVGAMVVDNEANQPTQVDASNEIHEEENLQAVES